MSEIISIPILELMEKTEQWLLNQGYKKNTLGVYKATYLGHKSYRETCWYIHLTIASFPELAQKLDSAFAGIIPVIGGEIIEEN